MEMEKVRGWWRSMRCLYIWHLAQPRASLDSCRSQLKPWSIVENEPLPRLISLRRCTVSRYLQNCIVTGLLQSCVGTCELGAMSVASMHISAAANTNVLKQQISATLSARSMCTRASCEQHACEQITTPAVPHYYYHDAGSQSWA